MNRIRIGCALTALAALLYGATGLLVSLTQFGVGIAVAAAAICVYGAVDFIEAHRDEKLARYRAEVWHRRDLEARQEAQLKPGIYTRPRDGLDR